LAASVAILWLGHAPAQEKVEKRPLTHNDYDIWRSIQQPIISADGHWAAYTLAPQDGDSEVVAKNIDKGTEYRHTRGKSAGFGGLAKGVPAPEPVGGGSVAFTADGKYLVFTIAPPKAAADQKKAPGDQPKNAMGIMDLANGKVTVVPNVSSWKLSEQSSTGLLYHRSPPVEAKKDAEKSTGAEEDLQGKKGVGGKKGDQVTPKAPKTPSDLVYRKFEDGKEVVIPHVVDYGLTRDSRVLVCSISDKDNENGVYAFAASNKPEGGLEKLALVIGKGRYSAFTWSEDQRYLAFFGDHAASPKDPPALSLYHWDRNAPMPKLAEGSSPPAVAVELLNAKATTGLKPGMVVVDRGGIRFSDDGSKIYLGVAAPAPPTPEKEPAKDAKDTKKDDKAVVELWHWKDDFIQPMQKVRANQEKMRTFSAIFHVLQKRLVQLGDKSLTNVFFPKEGNFALGSDDSPYAPLVAYDGNYADYYVVNTFDGTRKPLPQLKKHHWGVSLSPTGRFALFYDGKDWNTVQMPSGGIANITAKVPAKFSIEDWDQPAAAPSYGVLGWTADESNVLIYDKYDIWEVAAQGGGFRCLTSGVGAKEKVQFRYVKLDPKEKAIDTRRPLMLHAENLLTRFTGFALVDPTRLTEPKVLGQMHPVFFGNPIKAKNADMLILTAQTFYRFPDLWAAKTSMADIVQITDANPQARNFIWGVSELVHYKNADGVALSGTLIKPENFDAKKKYPMIVYIYEKLSQNVNHFVMPKAGTSINATYYASNGYLVFMPDIVYTTGYPGQSALKCVLPGIQAVVDKGFVDEHAIGIQGHSWGGYQIAYMITQTGRFKAAAAGAPVSNMTSAYDGIRWGSGLPRQFQYEKTQSRIGGSLWEFPMRFVENSPVFMADRVKTPLMMLHNDQDDAVPWYQGIEYYLALRRLGKEVYLFNYPGEPHGLRKKANEKDYTIRMQEFFDHHLKGAPMPEWMQRGIPYQPRPGVVTPPVTSDD
jgi:dipeptidyl aminopeptidase/acylaminoacyl peptidase